MSSISLLAILHKREWQIKHEVQWRYDIMFIDVSGIHHMKYRNIFVLCDVKRNQSLAINAMHDTFKSHELKVWFYSLSKNQKIKPLSMFYSSRLSCGGLKWLGVPLLGINQAAVLCACVCLHDTNAWNSLIHLPSPGQNGSNFADDIFRCIFVNETCCILIKISLKFVHRRKIDNNTVFVYIIAWHRPAAKPLYVPMIVRSLTHICVARHE